MGTRARRSRAEVEEIKDAYREMLGQTHPATLRQTHYMLVGRADTTYTNTRTDYNQLSKWLVRDRLEGVIPWGWIEDRLRVPRQVAMYNGLGEFLEVVRRAYRRDVWVGQPSYLEVWCEKDALSGIFEGVLRPYGVTLNVGRGYDGWTSIKDAARRFEAGGTVLYFGDFDPSGEDISRSLQLRLADPDLPNGGAAPEFVRCALNAQDLQHYNLPPDFTKTTDTRRAAFVERYGDVAVELDALPADVLRERIREEVETRMDMEALRHTRQLEQEDIRRLNSLLGEGEDGGR